MATDNDILYPDLSYKLVGCCYKVHNDIGRYGREKQYGERLEEVFRDPGIDYKREYYVPGTGNYVDFLVSDTVIIELKVRDKIMREDYYQVQRYHKAAKCKLGLLVNFRQRTLRPKRVVVTKR